MLQPLITSALAVLCYMTILYLIAQSVRNNSIVDIGWGPGFILITVVLALNYPALTDRAKIMMALTVLWAIRLSAHIFLRNHGKAEDFRYAEWRKAWGKREPLLAYLRVFLLQGFIMVFIGLPQIFSVAGKNNNLALINFIGILVFSAGFLFEAVADYQLAVFKRKTSNRGKILSSGVWRYSRHPNYFGEAVLWWGFWLISTGNGYWYISLVSPLLITIFLRFVSGVPMLEEKYRNRGDFIAYAQKTPIFIPFIGRKGL
jgi:steroid 5-alpha reductase family enzyme